MIAFEPSHWVVCRYASLALLFKGAAILRRLTVIEGDLQALLTREIARLNLGSTGGCAGRRCKMMGWSVKVKRFPPMRLPTFEDLSQRSARAFWLSPIDCIERLYQISFRWSHCA